MIALLAVLTLCVAVGSFACKALVKGKAAHVKSDLADVQGSCVKIKNEITSLKAYSSQRKWQAQLADGSKEMLGMLGSILKCVPDEVWLNQVKSSDKTGTVTVEGNSASFSALSTFISRLKCCPDFTEVRMSGTKIVKTETAAFLSFSLELKTKNAVTTTPAQPGQVPPAEGSQGGST